MNDLVLKANILGGMNDYILKVESDENIQMSWLINGIPDGCDEAELMEIAEDEKEFASICSLFGRLVKRSYLRNKA